MGEGFPATREDSVARLGAARGELLDAIGGLSSDELTRPVVGDWSVKDLLTHISSWEEQVCADLRRLARGHMPALLHVQAEEIDHWNEMIMSLRRNFPVEQALDELESGRAELLAGLERLDNGQFASGYLPVTIGITAGHDSDHARQIREWREAQGV